MPTQTSTATPMAGMSPQQIYDALMAVIHSELLTANLPHLDEGYEWETPQDRADRYANYDYAFMVLHETLEDLASAIKADGIELSAIAQAFSADDDRDALTDIDHSLNDA